MNAVKLARAMLLEHYDQYEKLQYSAVIDFLRATEPRELEIGR